MSAPTSQRPFDNSFCTDLETDTARPLSPIALIDLVLRPQETIRTEIRRTSMSNLFSQASTVATPHSGHSSERSLNNRGQSPNSPYSSSQGKDIEGEDPYSERLPLDRPPPIAEDKGHSSSYRTLRNKPDKRTQPSPFKRELRLSKLSLSKPSFSSEAPRNGGSSSHLDLLETFLAKPVPEINLAADIFEELANPRQSTSFTNAPQGESHDAASENGRENEEEPHTEEVPGYAEGCFSCAKAGAPKVNCEVCRYLRWLEQVSRVYHAANEERWVAREETRTPSNRFKSFFKKRGLFRNEEGKVPKARKLKKLFKPVVDTWQRLKKGEREN